MTTNNPFADCDTAEAAIAALDGTGAEMVRLGIFDVDAILREKAVTRAKAEKLLMQGYSFCDVLYHWDIDEQLYSAGAFPDEPAAIDPASGRVYPFADKTALFLADFTGPHAALSPRNLARAQIERAAAMGLGVRAAFEYEFFLFQETPESLREKDYRDLRSYAPGNRTYSALTAALCGESLAGLTRCLAEAGIGFDSLHTELGPGCFEAPLAVSEGLAAADNAALFKTFAKAWALREGLMACFMAKWSNDWPGQSGHLHLSLYRLDGGEPLFGTGRGIGGGGDGNEAPDPAMRHFIGGLTRHLPDFLAMSAHTANAYRRLVPGAWAPIHASWGVQNRSCALRAITRPDDAARVEYRVPAADANPYLALAACLGAGLTGLEEKIEPPAPETGDAYRSEVPPDRRFPRTLLEAAERFRRSGTARSLFGEAFVDWFADTREHEDRVFRGHVADLDRKRYFESV